MPAASSARRWRTAACAPGRPPPGCSRAVKTAVRVRRWLPMPGSLRGTAPGGHLSGLWQAGCLRPMRQTAWAGCTLAGSSPRCLRARPAQRTTSSGWRQSYSCNARQQAEAALACLSSAQPEPSGLPRAAHLAQARDALHGLLDQQRGGTRRGAVGAGRGARGRQRGRPEQQRLQPVHGGLTHLRRARLRERARSRGTGSGSPPRRQPRHSRAQQGHTKVSGLCRGLAPTAAPRACGAWPETVWPP